MIYCVCDPSSQQISVQLLRHLSDCALLCQHLNTKWKNNSWKNGVHSSKVSQIYWERVSVLCIVVEYCSCSGGSWRPTTGLTLLYVCFIFHSSPNSDNDHNQGTHLSTVCRKTPKFRLTNKIYNVLTDRKCAFIKHAHRWEQPIWARRLRWHAPWPYGWKQTLLIYMQILNSECYSIKQSGSGTFTVFVFSQRGAWPLWWREKWHLADLICASQTSTIM